MLPVQIHSPIDNAIEDVRQVVDCASPLALWNRP